MSLLNICIGSNTGKKFSQACNIEYVLYRALNIELCTWPVVYTSSGRNEKRDSSVKTLSRFKNQNIILAAVNVSSYQINCHIYNIN